MANFTVTLSEASTLTTTVSYATSDITAVAGKDYVAAQGTVTFQPGQTTATIPVTILGNATPTGTITFAVNLSNPVNAVLSATRAGDRHHHGRRIPSVGISVANTKVTVTGPADTVAMFAVTLFPARLGQVVTVQYMTVDGTAVAGKDYLAAQSVITFEPGSDNRDGPGDGLRVLTPQPTKQFSLMLSNASPTGTTIAIAQATATILNTVVVPEISIKSVQVQKPPSGVVPAVFTVSLSQATGETVTVNYATAEAPRSPAWITCPRAVRSRLRLARPAARLPSLSWAARCSIRTSRSS